MRDLDSKRINSIQRNFLIIGVVLGLFISLILYLFILDIEGKSFGLTGILALHTESFKIYIIGFIPVIIGSLLYYNGIKIGKIAYLSIDQLEEQNQQISKLSDFANDLGKGLYDSSYEPYGNEDILGNILIEMRDNTKTNLEEEKKRSWSVSGVAKFGEILRNNLNDMGQLGDKVIREMVNYLGANQGGVFIVEEEKGERYLDLVACYAYERKKFLNRQMPIDEGLVGQAMLEKDVIFLTEVPDGYVNITSGLGKATPRCVLIVPLSVNDDVLGVMEIASFHVLEEHEVDFVKTIANSFASTVSTVKMNQNTARLLEESTEMTKELQQKEEQMKQNAEELEATQKELSNKLFLIEEETTKTKNIVEAINKTNAAIEYDLEGTIIDVNDMFLSVTGYDREDLIGQNERFFVPEEEKNSPRYEIMWGSLSTGSFFSGEFRRISKNGKELWLTGTYNPIYNVSGQPVKIIKYAQFTTDEKEKALDLNSKINALGQVLPVLEVKPDGAMISGNKLFVEKFRYKRLKLKKMNIRDMMYSQKHKNEFENLFNSGGYKTDTLKIEAEIKDVDGVSFHYLANISPVLNLAEEVVKYLVLLVDISEQKILQRQLEQALEEERKKNSILDVAENQTKEVNQLLEEIVEELSSGVDLDVLVSQKQSSMMVLDTKGIVSNLNNTVLEMLRSQSETFIGKEIFDLFEFDSEEGKTKLRDTIARGSIGQEEVIFVVPGVEDKIKMHAVFAPMFSNDEMRILMLLIAIK